MDVFISKMDDNYMEFSIKGISPKMANILRRYVMNGVKVVAIDKVVFYENSSSIFDEYIAHRIGLIPLVVEGDVDIKKVGFYLDAVGPKKVMSGDLKSNNKKVRVAIENIPIVTLLENQAIRLEGYLKEGYGREHAKFQASVCSYELKDGSYNFFVEGVYVKPVKEVVLEALSRVKSELKELSKKF